MTPFPDALQRMLDVVVLLDTERVGLDEAAGRVLREAVCTDRPFPPFDRVMMDGFALRANDWRMGIPQFQVMGSAPAGQAARQLSPVPGTCIEVMTGAPVPDGADAIVPVEWTQPAGPETIRIAAGATVQAGRFIHRRGSDATPGAILVNPGTLLDSRAIGVAASCGAARLLVSRRPRLSVFATGDELAAVEATPLPHQIRQSNGHALRTALIRAGHTVQTTATLPDDPNRVTETLAHALTHSDFIILTGAVSKGAHDFIPSVLNFLGCQCVFHGVAQRPGKPAGCWRAPSGCTVAALPGNPVSALTCLHAFVLPALDAASGRTPTHPLRFPFEDAHHRQAGFTVHLPVRIDHCQATAAPTGNSGDFTGLLRSDGFLILPPDGTPCDEFAFTPWI